MQEIKKTTVNKTLIAILLLYTLLCGFIIIHYNLTVPVSILLFLSGGGVVLLVNPFLKPVVDIKRKKLEKEQKIVDKHKAIAKKAGKKPFPKGPNNVHTVWAANTLQADKLYHLHIAPKLRASPNKMYYYISKNCNNTK